MILIVGSDVDLSTFQIIDYLIYEEIPFVKVNDADIVHDVSMEIDADHSKIILRYADITLDSNLITSYYYRRGSIRLPELAREYYVDGISTDQISEYLVRENRAIHRGINLILESASVKIGSYFKHDLGKFRQLFEAKRLQLKVPPTFVIQSKRELKKLIDRYGKLATKATSSNFISNIGGDSGYNMFTSLIGEDELELIPDVFFPTLFQVYITKRIELRIFYLHGKFYPMAIFSQENEGTKVDFRRYDMANPNRNVPYSLAADVTIKLEALMKCLGLDTGSIDMIVTPDSEYFFLEVNPDGQFGMVSKPCNYFIEREIARYLSTR